MFYRHQNGSPMQLLTPERPIYKLRERRYGEATFPLKVIPLDDELLSSWLIRVALEHKTVPSTFTNLYLPETKNKLWAGDVDLHADDTLLERLSVKAAVPVETLLAMTFRSYEGVLFERLHPATGGTSFLLKMAMRGRWSRSPGIRWCPDCLLEDNCPYFRKKWRLSLFTVCLRHRKYLADRCSCGKSLTLYKSLWLDGRPNCPHCRADLADVAKEYRDVEYSIVDAEERIRQIMDDGYVVMGGVPVYTHLYFRVLHHILRLLMNKKWGGRLWNEVGLELSVSRAKAFERMVIVDQAKLIERAVWLLDEWPERFVDVCRRQRILSSALLHDLVDAPFWYWDVVMREMYRPDRVVSEEEIRAAIKYMKKHGMLINQQRLSRLLGVSEVFRKRKLYGIQLS